MSEQLPFEVWCGHVRQGVETMLADWLATPEMPSSLREAMGYSLLGGGKRVRALLVAAACEAVGGYFIHSIGAGGAIECLHAYSLVHDDLPAMDDDDLRRGKPTSHVKFGEAMAILVGDALQSASYEILAATYSPTQAGRLIAALALAGGSAGMVGGQVLDLTMEGRVREAGPPADRDIEFLRRIHSLKTGALFRAAVQMGEIIGCNGKMNPTQSKTLETYSACFGMVFQITDDLIDAESDAATAGKETGKDAAKGKLTYPGVLGLEGSRAEVKRLTTEGLAALESFGERAEPLRELLRLLGNRKK